MSKLNNAQVTYEECGGDIEKMIKKFSRKVKKDRILELHLKSLRFKKPSVERNEKKIKRERKIKKINSK